MSRNTLKSCVLLAVLVLASSSCGDVARQGRSPVYLVIDSMEAAQGSRPDEFFAWLFSDVVTNVTDPAPCSENSPCATVFGDVARATFRIALKDIGTPLVPTVPTTNNEVTITRYRVSYKRADGRNTPGIDVPFPFDGAATGTVPANGQLTLGFEIVRHTAKGESPLRQLVTNSTIITTIAEVTFWGRDRVGNEISATGYIQVDFGNFGDNT